MASSNSTSRTEPESNQLSNINPSPRRRGIDFQFQQELARLQEMVYDSFHLPLTRWTVVDEVKLLDHLEMISDTVPNEIKKALALLEQEQQIYLEAQEYAKNIVHSAQERAAEILDETGIIQQAQLEAAQIRQQVQRECEELQQKTITEVEQMRRAARQELKQMHQQTIAECEEIQRGADDYADAVLVRLEQELNSMLKVVQNGRQQLHANVPPPPTTPPPKKLPSDKPPRFQQGKKRK